MNPNPDSIAPDTPDPSREPEPSVSLGATAEATQQVRSGDWRYWVKSLLVCNPFFLCSAALLLFGVNRLSLDPNFLGDETQNLLFNFFALQGYELLVVITALVLARRKVWYDSALLVVLENGLVLVPFMLISQATLIGGSLATSLTLAGGALAVCRFAGVRRWYGRFNLPNRALVLGWMILAANVALPRIFRSLIEQDVADWQIPNLIAWYGVLPLMAAGANLLPRPPRYGGLNPERHWLPLFNYGLWISGSAVHLWCVQHICGLPFALSQAAPAAFVAVWTLRGRIRDCLEDVTPNWERALLFLTAAAPLVAVDQPRLFVVLTGLNLVAYAVLTVAGREPIRALALQLALASGALLVAGCPLGWGSVFLPDFLRPQAIVAGLTLYLMLQALRSSRAEFGLAAALAVTVDTAALVRTEAFHPALQAGLLLALLHSLRWRDQAQPGAGFLRNTLAVLWILDAVIYTRGLTSSAVGVTGGGALFVLAGWALVWWWRGERVTWVLPIAASLSLLTGPGHWLIRMSTVGLIAMAASLVLFAVGTLIAWTRHRWEMTNDK